MITKDQAINIANEYVLEQNKITNYVFILLLNQTVEFELGWVFFYQTKEYFESGNIMYAAGGNAPIIIDKRTGAIHVTGTAHPINKYIVDYFKREEKK